MPNAKHALASTPIHVTIQTKNSSYQQIDRWQLLPIDNFQSSHVLNQNCFRHPKNILWKPRVVCKAVNEIPESNHLKISKNAKANRNVNIHCFGKLSNDFQTHQKRLACQTHPLSFSFEVPEATVCGPRFGCSNGHLGTWDGCFDDQNMTLHVYFAFSLVLGKLREVRMDPSTSEISETTACKNVSILWKLWS